ncbi:MAG: hypothetical protein SNF33_05365 [Candidatus Algichlamydia australiensis]|nr:hypothetical protein [Chlamydiales bacterium]
MLAIPVHTFDSWNQGIHSCDVAKNAALTSLVGIAATTALLIDKNIYSLPKPHWIITATILLASDASLLCYAIKHSKYENLKKESAKVGLITSCALLTQGVALSQVAYLRNFFIHSNPRILAVGVFSAAAFFTSRKAAKKKNP